MRKKILIVHQLVVWGMTLLMALPPGVLAQQPAGAAVFKQEELDQILAPIALYPDSLVAQILMASTYPLEVVQADRFAKQNASLKGEALTKALESQSWDPSVKSLVNFPQVLTMMSEKLDWTQKLGDAFLAQQKPVMDTIQSLRAKAQAAGNLKTTKEQTVIVEEKIIKIEPASPQVIYVPTYNPTVVYGAWPYPAYPPYYYYPPGYVATTTAFSFACRCRPWARRGVMPGEIPTGTAANVEYQHSRNTNINNNINRQNYSSQTVQQRYNQATPSQQVQARQAYRGHTGSALTPNGTAASTTTRATSPAKQTDSKRHSRPGGSEPDEAPVIAAGAADRGRRESGRKARGESRRRKPTRRRWRARRSGSRGGAFEGVDRGGSSARSASQRGSASRRRGGGGGRSGGGEVAADGAGSAVYVSSVEQTRSTRNRI